MIINKIPKAMKYKLNYTDEDIKLCLSILDSEQKKKINSYIKWMKNLNKQDKNNRIFNLICVIIESSD